MNYHVLTLFPDMVRDGLSTSILGRAAENGQISLNIINIRDYTQNKHKKVDDYPYGGGAGMLMQAQPVYDAWKSIRRPARVIYVTPQGQVFSQKKAQELAQEEDLIFLCGHYEGIDERVLERIVTDYVSIGDYVLTGGELPAMVIIDAVSRLIPGVLNNQDSAETESFQGELLEYPQYSRPEEWEGMRVPSVLLSGNHSLIEKWRLTRSQERTAMRRPDLYEQYERRSRAEEYLQKDKLHHMDMLELIHRDQCDIIYAREGGVLIRDRCSGAWMLSAADEDMGERLISLIPRKEELKDHSLLFVAHQKFIADSICRRYEISCVNECRQAVYTKKIPIAVDPAGDLEIRPLSIEHLELVYANYHVVHDRQYLRKRIEAGWMFGAFRNGVLTGFAGMHDEGGMGMLEVLNEYRRCGIGAALEIFLINRILKDGYVPLCQIFVDNVISEKLQRRLGLKLSQKSLYWIS